LELDIVDALLSGQRRAQQADRKRSSKADTFGRGAAWVKTMLMPGIQQAAAALETHGVTIRLDTNLDNKALITRMQIFGWQQKTIQSRVPSTRLMC
jgi:hypothetical protein